MCLRKSRTREERERGGVGEGGSGVGAEREGERRSDLVFLEGGQVEQKSHMQPSVFLNTYKSDIMDLLIERQLCFPCVLQSRIYSLA